MSNNSAFLSKVNEATGLELTVSDLELIFSMQNEEQNDQYKEDLKKAVLIYQDTMDHGGMIAEKAIPVWEEVNKRIALWSSWASMATPVRKGFFGRKEIPFVKRMMLRDLLSPNCDLMKSGKLDI